MASLSETQISFRRAIAVLMCIIVIFYIGRFALNQGVSLYRHFFPVKVPDPEAKYGALPQLKMSSIKVGGNPQYILDTRDGRLPDFKDRIKVYVIPKTTSTLLSEQTVKNLAADFGFDNNFQKRSASEFVWIDGINNRTYNADAVSGSFQLSTPIDKLNSVVNGTVAITATDATNEVSGFLRSKELLSSTDLPNISFTTTPAIVSLGKIRESKLDTQRAKLMRVDVFKKLITQPADEKAKTPEVSYKILGPNPRSSLMNFYVTNAKDPFKFPIVNFVQWKNDYSDSSEYYISSISSVWNTVSQGKGVVSYLKVESGDAFDPFPANLEVDRIEIKDISMAYFEPREFNPYLQPIYVFEGKFFTKPVSGQLAQQGDIIIYYPAVRGDYVKN